MNESTLVPCEEMRALDWLARNVHVWPENDIIEIATTEIPSKLAFDGVAFSLQPSGLISQHAVYATKDQWLARRAELQNKPGWGKHGWPQIFQNEDGHWFGARAEWDFKAHISGGWKGDGVSLLRDDGEYLRSGTILGDWRDTLEKRPEQTIADICREVTGENRHEEIFEPFVSVEDAATAKQPAPKGSGNPILGMVLADLTNRALEGKEKYGEPLLANNGRNPLWDAYQEALDLAMYLRQAIEEQK